VLLYISELIAKMKESGEEEDRKEKTAQSD